MRLQVRHITTYRYDRPITLGRHILRMHPRLDGAFALESFDMSVHPQPAGISPLLDPGGNLAHEVWFQGETTHEFRISYRWSGRTSPRYAWDLLPTTDVRTLPPHYGVEKSGLGPVLSTGEAVPPYALADFARAAAIEAKRETLPFLQILEERIRNRLRNSWRLTGPPMDPAVTLAGGQGSCRDLAVLFIACCRLQGVAARFVSGYVPAGAGSAQHMHAWAEAYLTGAGWRPFDPSQTEPVGEKYVAVAAAAEPADAAPISGYFSGSPTRSEMDVELTVETEDG